ncbi:D-amino acid oxidase [Stutzerimonas stutzeri]|uniref:D-amino acid oxidase n=1 Tax=Stutzerimonas stutzeri TaxID=316 RepID=W8R2L5_STUST|nr:FAD-dependent oxidoreductase [Stutzerimonas stutzeri]AHL73758.1 D-amino acid oxidase [Stutzerimonas stutzeri]MCQ4328725.1 FAD-binding oxidoreductase [Stutzerimonas stutzeri]
MNADVIIIGAGIVGAACANELAANGLDVLLLDAQRGGATAAGMGHLVALDDNPAELALSDYSIQRWRELGRLMDDSCGYRNNGTLWLAANEAEMAVAEHKLATLSEQGMSCELLGGAALRAAEPELRSGLHGALKVSGDGIIYAPNAARWLIAQGGKHIVQRQACVTCVQGQQVELSDGSSLRAQAVVLANGIHATELCPDLPIQPKKGHLVITDRYPGKVTHTLVELGYVTSAHNSAGPSVACNIQPRPTGQLFIGSSRQFGTRDPEIDSWMLARMLKRAVDYMPGLARMNAIRSWTGFRAASPDGLPLVGEHPQQSGLWLAVGHEGLGVTTAPGTAELLTAQLLGRPSAMAIEPYSPARFIPSSGGSSAPAYAMGNLGHD